MSPDPLALNAVLSACEEVDPRSEGDGFPSGLRLVRISPSPEAQFLDFGEKIAYLLRGKARVWGLHPDKMGQLGLRIAFDKQ